MVALQTAVGVEISCGVHTLCKPEAHSHLPMLHALQDEWRCSLQMWRQMYMQGHSLVSHRENFLPALDLTLSCVTADYWRSFWHDGTDLLLKRFSESKTACKILWCEWIWQWQVSC